MVFSSLKDCFWYGRKFARNQGLTHDELYIELCAGGPSCKLLGDLGSVAMEHFADRVQ